MKCLMPADVHGTGKAHGKHLLHEWPWLHRHRCLSKLMICSHDCSGCSFPLFWFCRALGEEFLLGLSSDEIWAMRWSKFFLKFTGKQWEVKSAVENLKLSQLGHFSLPPRNESYKQLPFTQCQNMKSSGPQGSRQRRLTRALPWWAPRRGHT